DFIRTQKDSLKRFLKAWLEGIKIFKTDKDFTLRVLRKYLRVEDREILDKSYEQYKPVFETIPYPERKGVTFAIQRMAEGAAEASKLRADDFLEPGILTELVNEGFIKELYPEKGNK
ncbi:MAG: hypothetical protein ACREOR_08540, partial [Candidatus Binatia bacterium]